VVCVKHWGMSHSDFVSIAVERCRLAEDGRQAGRQGGPLERPVPAAGWPLTSSFSPLQYISSPYTSRTLTQTEHLYDKASSSTY
jgi:hypothetical protein